MFCPGTTTHRVTQDSCHGQERALRKVWATEQGALATSRGWLVQGYEGPARSANDDTSIERELATCCGRSPKGRWWEKMLAGVSVKS